MVRIYESDEEAINNFNQLLEIPNNALIIVLFEGDYPIDVDGYVDNIKKKYSNIFILNDKYILISENSNDFFGFQDSGGNKYLTQNDCYVILKKEDVPKFVKYNINFKVEELLNKELVDIYEGRLQIDIFNNRFIDFFKEIPSAHIIYNAWKPIEITSN